MRQVTAVAAVGRSLPFTAAWLGDPVAHAQAPKAVHRQSFFKSQRSRGVVYVLDTSLLLGGKDPPRDGTWATTPEAAAEISPGGRDARRYALWLDLGLQLRQAGRDAARQVEDVSQSAGNRARLSPADLSLLALALEMKAILLTDDHTMLDVARRLGVTTRTVNSTGISGTLDFRPRCSGCGRWFDAPQKANECPVCGSPVKDKPWKPADKPL